MSVILECSNYSLIHLHNHKYNTKRRLNLE